jgi:hypothetical protein
MTLTLTDTLRTRALVDKVIIASISFQPEV